MSVCIFLVINEMNNLARIALSPDDKYNYETTNRNMRDLDPD